MRVQPELLKLIKENKKFLIVSHVNPDGDAIGSIIALAIGLKKMGKYVYILNKDPVPDILKFLPHSDLINTKVPSKNFDVLLITDCNSLERTGFKYLPAKATAVIDHHLTIKKNKKYTYLVTPKASSTGELVYKLFKILRIPIDREIAVNLYTAIFTDTGGFRFSNTNIESLNIASDLIKAGANTWEIAKEVYENIPLNCLRLLTLTLLTLEKRGKTASVTVTQSMFRKTNTSAQHTENFADYPRKIKGIEVGVLFREEGKNLYKVSLRSKGAVNVAYIARTFGGGGHASAAGCTLEGNLAEVKNKVLRAVRKAIKWI